jgi:hypothetical protein
MTTPSGTEHIGRTGPLAALLAILLSLVLALPAAAQERPPTQDVRLTLVVPEPQDEDNPEIRRRQRQEMARLGSTRIEERLTRAGIKGFKVNVLPHGQIQVQVHGRHTRQQIANIVVPAGRMELRPVVSTGEAWVSIASSLPVGIELRQEADSLSDEDVYLWSADFSTLSDFSRRVALGTTHVFVYPDAEGWRTMSLAAPVATHRDIEKVDMRTTPAGVPFIMVELQRETPSRIRNDVDMELVKELAVVLDDEIVSIVRFEGARAGQRLELVCPPHLTSQDARRAWVQQVTGRLAVPMPITLGEL